MPVLPLAGMNQAALCFTISEARSRPICSERDWTRQ
jgi:hypothetical protein